MGDAMAGQTIEVFGLQRMLVAHFDGVWPAPRQRSKKLVQVGDKVAAMFVIAGIKAREFKHEQPDIFSERLRLFFASSGNGFFWLF